MLANIEEKLAPRFGEIFLADLPYTNGSVQGGVRPVVIVQNNIGNSHSTTIEVLPLSSRISKAAHLPTHVFMSPDQWNGLTQRSVVLAENVWTVPKILLLRYMGFLDETSIVRIAMARYIQSPLPYPDAHKRKEI